MKIILNGSVDLYEDGIDFEDLEVEIEDECDEFDIEDYMMDCDECGFCDDEDEDEEEYDDGFFYDDYDYDYDEECDNEIVKNVALLGLLDHVFDLFEDE